MNKRPLCEIPGCKNEALFMIDNKPICGTCYLKYIRKIQNKKWEDIKDATK